MNEVLDIFYNQVLKEIATGRVDCGMMYNVLFKARINNETLYNLDKNIVKNNSLLIPTLIINNKKEFDESLIKYYEKAKYFYEGKIDKEDNFQKTILTLLWNNATEDDFKHPIEYINRYISYLDKPLDIELNKYQNIGYSKTLESNIEICLKEEPINEETPFGLYIRSTKNNLYYEFPVVRFGIHKNKAYIYAVQQKKNKDLENEENYKYEKFIHRKLFKVNENFEKEENIDNITNPENLTGISPSALISLSITLSLLNNKNITEIEVPTFLPIRYNAKEISYIIRKKLLEEKGYDVETINNLIHDYEEHHEQIQRNLSDKLLRYFRRLEYHFNNINVISHPYELDCNTHLSLKEYTDCNNNLLKEVYQIANEKHHNDIKTL